MNNFGEGGRHFDVRTVTGELASAQEIESATDLAEAVMRRGCDINYDAIIAYEIDGYSISFAQELQLRDNDYTDTASVHFFDDANTRLVSLYFDDSNNLDLQQSTFTDNTSVHKARELVGKLKCQQVISHEEEQLLLWTKAVLGNFDSSHPIDPAAPPIEMHTGIIELFTRNVNPAATATRIERIASIADSNNRYVHLIHTQYTGDPIFFSDEVYDAENTPAWEIYVEEDDNSGRGLVVKTYADRPPETGTYGYKSEYFTPNTDNAGSLPIDETELQEMVARAGLTAPTRQEIDTISSSLLDSLIGKQ